MSEDQAQSTPQSEVTSTSSVPTWFWIVSVVMLIWNLMGLAAFAMIMMMLGNKDSLVDAGFNEAQIELMNNTPTWVNAAFAVAVICGTLGCVALLMRSKWSILLLAFSLVGVLAQDTYVFFLSNTVELMGIGLAPVVIPISIALPVFAIYCAKQGWIK